MQRDLSERDKEEIMQAMTEKDKTRESVPIMITEVRDCLYFENHYNRVDGYFVRVDWTYTYETWLAVTTDDGWHVEFINKDSDR